MRGAPQAGFFATIRRISPRTSVDSFFPAELSSLSRSSSGKVEIGTMPANDRLKINEHERLLPSTPETTGECPEDFVNRSHPGSGMPALQHSQLLPESEIFQEQASMRIESSG
jgi:hypothetical protein